MNLTSTFYNGKITHIETTAVRQNEHRLAQKAQGIYEHRQRLDALVNQKTKLHAQKPTVGKEQLSYLESIEFGEEIKKYENELKTVDLKIQKLSRELNALKKQAEKLLPAPAVRKKYQPIPMITLRHRCFAYSMYNRKRLLMQTINSKLNP